ncbi:MAG: alkaline phosphatase family protein [Pseudomonadota bacterium]
MKLILSLVFMLGSQLALAKAQPKLLIVFVVDQMRADYLQRFHEYFIPEGPQKKDGGFRWLMANGASFADARHLTIAAMTCPGHATLLTGTTPSRHGIFKNSWYDENTGKEVYCVEDELAKSKTDTDPSSSPRRLLAPTLGDEIKSVSPLSRVYSVALKDRAAIMMGGKRADLAIWMNHKKMSWTTSDWYLPKTTLPQWVMDENRMIDKDRKSVFTWNASIKDYPKEPALGFLSGLPIQFSKNDESSLSSPYGIELTERMALATLNKNGLGKGKYTDILAISFSTTDYVGHQFGPTHQAMLEILKSADAAIARIIKEAQRGRQPSEIVFALTADHGIPPVPEGAPSSLLLGQRISGKEELKALESAISAKFGPAKSGNWIAARGEFHFFLSSQVPDDQKLVISQFAKKYLASRDWVSKAYTRSDIVDGKITDQYLKMQLEATFPDFGIPDFGVVVKPYSTAGDNTVTHMTGYTYDTRVPLLLSGAEIKQGTYKDRVYIHDLAPTLAYLLGFNPPALATGRILSESLK